MLDILPNQRKEVALQIKTLVIDKDDSGNDSLELLCLIQRVLDGDVAEISEIEQLIGRDQTDEIELCTEATAELNSDGYVEIAYLENEDDSTLATLSKIMFRPSEPELVIMTRSGAMNAVLSFEEGKTHVCTYDTPFMRLKAYVTSKKVRNELLDGGSLTLHYDLNINGNPEQRFIVNVKMKENTADTLKNIVQ